jgi:hypothetical protein
MLSFIEYLFEAVKKVKAPKEASAKNAADSMGKLHELLVGKELNGGKHLEHHRDENGLHPINAHAMHAEALFGREYRGSYYNDPGYQKMVADAKQAADDIREHLAKKHGITDISRVAWTSQKSDHLKETGVDDPNSKADLIVTSGHPKHKGKKLGISLKVGKTKTPNYANPGVSTFEKWSGTNLQDHVNAHGATLDKHGNPSHDQFKEMRDSSNAKLKAKAAEIKASSDKMNAGMAATMRGAMSNKSHDELRDLIKNSTSPQTHLHEIVSHTVYNKDGSSAHSVHPHSDHINNYVDKFDDLHVKSTGKGNSVVIHGTHRKTGKVMPVWQTTVYAGGRPANRSPRGATTLPSESKIGV